MDFRVNSMRLTGPEIEVLKRYGQHMAMDTDNKYLTSPGENREFIEKLKKLEFSSSVS